MLEPSSSEDSDDDYAPNASAPSQGRKPGGGPGGSAGGTNGSVVTGTGAPGGPGGGGGGGGGHLSVPGGQQR